MTEGRLQEAGAVVVVVVPADSPASFSEGEEERRRTPFVFLPTPHATVALVGTGLTSRSCQSSPDLVGYAELLIFLQAGCRSAEMPPRLPGAWI